MIMIIIMMVVNVDNNDSCSRDSGDGVRSMVVEILKVMNMLMMEMLRARLIMVMM